jgi:hemoglobin-like flavoprotein
MSTLLEPITAQQVTLLKKSFRQLDTQQIAAKFYSKLFERHPEVKRLFPPDMVDLGKKLMSVFELVVFSFEEITHDKYMLQQSVIVPLRELGRKHDDKGIQPEHYTIANSLLLETMQEEAGPDFTDEVKECWRVALFHLTTTMLDRSVLPPRTIIEASGSTLRDSFTFIKQLLNKPKTSN